MKSLLKDLRLSALVIIIGAAPTASLSEQIIAGTCPAEIFVEKKGEWAGVENDEFMVQALRENRDRRREISAIYVVDDESGLEASVVTLPSLAAHQGNIRESDFEDIQQSLAKAFEGPTPEMQQKIEDAIRKNLSGTGFSASHLAYESAILSPGKLIGFAFVEADIPGFGLSYFETAVEMQHIHGCVVQTNFSIEVSPGSRERLRRAIDDFELR